MHVFEKGVLRGALFAVRRALHAGGFGQASHKPSHPAIAERAGGDGLHTVAPRVSAMGHCLPPCAHAKGLAAHREGLYPAASKGD